MLNRTGKKKLRGVKYFLIAVPFMIFLFLFCYVPVFGWIYAFFNYKLGQPLRNMPFVGLANFAKLFTNRQDVLRVLRNTLVFSGLGLLLSPLPILVAIMLNEIPSSKFRRFIQTTTTLPNFISWIIVFGISWAFFSNNGLVNKTFASLGIEQSPTGIMGSLDAVWFFQTALGVWKSLGWNTIIYLAAILGIDVEQYEAAKVDGANRLHCIWYITVPGILPTYFVLLLLQISNILNTGFDQYFVFTNPMVAKNIQVLDYYVYQVGIMIKDYSFSIAIGIIKSLISIMLLFCANYFSKRIRGDAIF